MRLRSRCFGIVTDDELLNSRLPVLIDRLRDGFSGSHDSPVVVGADHGLTGGRGDPDSGSADPPNIVRRSAHRLTVSIKDARLAAKLRAGRPGMPRSAKRAAIANVRRSPPPPMSIGKASCIGGGSQKASCTA